LIKLKAYQGQLLTNVIVQLSGDPVTLLLLGIN
jgi:hypothetical protein